MNKIHIKLLNKKIDKLLRFKKLPAFKEIGIPIELIKKYDLTYTKTLRCLTDKDLDRIIGGESQE